MSALVLMMLAQMGQPMSRWQPNQDDTSRALFEFAPSSGAGMGAACACTTPTGAKGEALTFTRTGNATCSKQGLATTGIANGDLVVCAGDQPRVEPSGGVLGLRVEGARTNSLLRSQELDNAAWTLDFAGGGVIPTRTANAATAPDGTTTAERLQFSACPTIGDSSVIYQLHATTGASATSIYCRGNGSTQSISICSFGSGGSSGCSSVSCPSTSWSRVQDLRTAVGVGGIVVGCNNVTASYAGASNTGAADVFLWQAQSEMGATYVTSPIPTVAAAVARNTETNPRFTDASIATAFPLGGTFSISATVQTVFSVCASGQAAVEIDNVSGSGSPPALAYCSGGFAQGFSLLGGLINTGVAWGSGLNRLAYDSSRRVAYNATAVTAASTTMGATGTIIAIGGNGAQLPPDGIITSVCVDPSPSRCR